MAVNIRDIDDKKDSTAVVPEHSHMQIILTLNQWRCAGHVFSCFPCFLIDYLISC
jgi:hypothetical protein